MRTNEFALCLTHDVDRPYKTFQAPYYTFKRRDLSHIKSLLSSTRPYWQFENIMDLEDELGVRSAFYFLNERHLFREMAPTKWPNPTNWKLFLGRYDIEDEEIVGIIQKLHRNGWEIGLHGSYNSYTDLDRLRCEKRALERILGEEIVGGRQHYLRLQQPKTWEYHRSIGLKYDASLGSSTEYGFDDRYSVIRPFGDEFVVYPLTIMERALMESTESIEAAWAECRRLLEEARDHGAVMTILWHPRYFNEHEYPGYRTIYERLIEEALSMNAWVGPPSVHYEQFQVAESVS